MREQTFLTVVARAKYGREALSVIAATSVLLTVLGLFVVVRVVIALMS